MSSMILKNINGTSKNQKWESYSQMFKQVTTPTQSGSNLASLICLHLAYFS